MKKIVFNDELFLPLKRIADMQCSENMGVTGDVSVFFCLSGTGKTTLFSNPKRQVIGDNAHGWDDEGVFNFEGGCYAKTIELFKSDDPDIYHAIKRDALLEKIGGFDRCPVDFKDSSKIKIPGYFILLITSKIL